MRWYHWLLIVAGAALLVWEYAPGIFGKKDAAWYAARARRFKRKYAKERRAEELRRTMEILNNENENNQPGTEEGKPLRVAS